jgi:ABC-type maltose transport system permease subunit
MVKRGKLYTGPLKSSAVFKGYVETVRKSIEAASLKGYHRYQLHIQLMRVMPGGKGEG